MLDKVTFEFNIPETVVLKFADGKEVDGRFGPQVYFSLDDGRCMYVAPIVADKIQKLGVRPGEEIEICKRSVSKGRTKSVEWEVARAGENQAAGASDSNRQATARSGESIRPEQQIHRTSADSQERERFPNQPAELEQQLQQSITQVADRRAPTQMNQNNMAQVLGPSASVLFELSGYAAVDAAAKVQQYAQKQGLAIAFAAEDVRAIWATFFIGAQKSGGTQWRN